MRAVGARRMVLIHWDDFLRRPAVVADVLDATMRVPTRLADIDGVPLHLPQLWHRADPWRWRLSAAAGTPAAAASRGRP